jgi:hypothetical protein
VSIGVRASYSPEDTWQAEGFLEAINVALEQRGLPPYQDAHDLQGVDAGSGRSPEFIGDSAIRHWFDIASGYAAFGLRGPRDVYLPSEFTEPLEVPFYTWGRFQWFPRGALVGSHGMLQLALEELATVLDIPLTNAALSDDVVNSISKRVPLRPQADSREDVQELRPAWLLYFEGLRMARERQCALCVHI